MGIVAQTGSAVAVALTGSPRRPEFAGRWPVELVPDDLPVQYHAAAGMDPDAAEALVRRVEQAAGEAAGDALRSLTDLVFVDGVGLLVKPTPRAPGTVAAVVRNHVAMHTAEGELYLDALMSAAEQLGLPVQAIPPDALPEATDRVAAIGKAAGRPWRRQEKDAARCALVLLGSEIG